MAYSNVLMSWAGVGFEKGVRKETVQKLRKCTGCEYTRLDVNVPLPANKISPISAEQEKAAVQVNFFDSANRRLRKIRSFLHTSGVKSRESKIHKPVSITIKADF